MQVRRITTGLGLAVLCLTSGCAGPQSYMGIDISDAAARADAPQIRQIAQTEVEFLRLGLILGCIAPANADNLPRNADSPACREYIAELIDRTEAAESGVPIPVELSKAPLVALARLAESGNKFAQLELGIRFEEGRGLPVDVERARRLYELAATDSQGVMPIYQAGVGESPGSTLTVPRGPIDEGLAEARDRLEALSAADR